MLQRVNIDKVYLLDFTPFPLTIAYEYFRFNTFCIYQMSIQALSNKEDNAVALLKSIGQLEINLWISDVNTWNPILRPNVAGVPNSAIVFTKMSKAPIT